MLIKNSEIIMKARAIKLKEVFYLKTFVISQLNINAKQSPNCETEFHKESDKHFFESKY